MSNSIYRLLIGLMLLIMLYFDIKYVMWGIIAVVLFEGITDLRTTNMVSRLLNKQDLHENDGCLAIQFKQRINFDAERAWRIMVGVMLIISYVIFPATLWGFSWFMAIAILGAGVSGVCPMYLFLKWIGFK